MVDLEEEEKMCQRNNEHYMDSTAYQAMKNIEAEKKATERYKKLLGCIFRICELAGFHVEERIVLKDLRTGKIWR